MSHAASRLLVGALAAGLALAGCGSSSTGRAAAPVTTERSRSAGSPSGQPVAAASASVTTAAPSGPAAGSASTQASGASGGMGASSGAGTCLALAQSLTTKQKIGQLFMLGTQSQRASDLRSAVTSAQVGSVVLLGSAPRSMAGTRSMTSQLVAWSSARVPLVVATDQEGGLVQRLVGGGFSRIPSAATQSTWSTSKLVSQWTTYGGQMRQAGIRYDLAPVADVVPAEFASRNEPVALLHRGYGATTAEVSPRVAAVTKGLTASGVASSAKHFPGLGRVVGNTDFATATDSSTTTADLGSFAAAMQAGASSVMISSAVYTRIDAANPAVFSHRIITDELRGRLGWNRAVISDDMGAAASLARVPAAERGVRFLAAGGDLVLTVEASTLDEMMAAVAARVRSDPAFAAQLDAHVERVLRLKAEVGITQCR